MVHWKSYFLLALKVAISALHFYGLDSFKSKILRSNVCGKKYSCGFLCLTLLDCPAYFFRNSNQCNYYFFPPFVQPTPPALRSFTNMTIARARFDIPARVKTDPILNNYLAQTMEDNARSGLRPVQGAMSLIFVFPTVARREKTCVVFEVLDQRKPIE